MAETSEYSVDCDCGKTLPVVKSDAGSAIQCRCGRTVRVPRLSLLRRAKGEGALESGILDRIARMIRDGQLPAGDCCAVSGFPTKDVMLFDVQCETSYVKGERKWGWALVILGFFMPFWWLFWLLGYELLSERNERTMAVTLSSLFPSASPMKIRLGCGAGPPSGDCRSCSAACRSTSSS